VNHSGTFTDLLNDLFTGTARPSLARPTAAVAEACMQSTIASLQVGDDRQAQFAGMLDGARLVLSIAEPDHLLADASIAVAAVHLAALRTESDQLKSELAAAVAHHGWRLRELQFVAADPVNRPATAPPKRGEMIEQLAYAIADKKAYEVEAFCDQLGLAPHPSPEADPWRSKAVYARIRLAGLKMPELVRIARQVLEEIDCASLEALIDRYRPSGPAGAVKNLVFGSTRKPDLVLTDALSNDIALVNPDAALIYDDGIPDEGLSWRKLVHALLTNDAATNERAAARKLFVRLLACLGSEPERLFFQAYANRYKGGFDQPALVPQGGSTTILVHNASAVNHLCSLHSGWTFCCCWPVVNGSCARSTARLTTPMPPVRPHRVAMARWSARTHEVIGVRRTFGASL
jgi:hypothetical protein